MALYPRFQRFCGEAGVKLGKVDKLFVTGTGAEEHAGLTELILTLSALGSPTLEVFGPEGIDEFVVRKKRRYVSTPRTVCSSKIEAGVRGGAGVRYHVSDFSRGLKSLKKMHLKIVRCLNIA